MDRSGISIQNVQVAFVEKQTASSFSTGLSQDAHFDHAIHRGGRGWKAHFHLACCVPDREEWIGLSVPVDQERRRRTAAEALNLFLVCIEESVDAASSPGRLIRGVPHTLQEEVQPGRPAFAFSRLIEPVIVKAPMLLEEKAEVKNGFAQYLLGTEHEGNEQPSDPAIAVEERMDRFELCMYKAGLYQ